MNASLIIRERQFEDDPAIVAIRNQSSTNWPPISLERYRYRINPDNIPPGGISERYVGTIDDRIVGLSFMGGNWFFQRPATYLASVAVDEDHQGQGFGSAMYEHIVQRASHHGANRLYADFIESHDRAKRFATDRGFKVTDRIQRCSRLIVADACFDGYEDAERRVQESGIVIRRLSEMAQDDNFLHRLHEMMYEAEKDIPSSEVWPQEPFDIWYRHVFEAPGSSPELFWVALDGEEPVSMAALISQTNDIVSNGLTATARAYRGRGLARVLKKTQIEWCRENGIEQIYTGNDIENHRMLAINVRLGYKPVPSEIELVKDL